MAHIVINLPNDRQPADKVYFVHFLHKWAGRPSNLGSSYDHEQAKETEEAHATYFAETLVRA